jgi:nucleoside-diphosphate-sugar epimerase
MTLSDPIIGVDDKLLITGANGFIGNRVVQSLLEKGYKNLRCFVRPSGNLEKLNDILKNYADSQLQIIKGNLLSKDDCRKAVNGAFVIIHLAAGVGKAYPTCVMNSVVTTRNLLDASVESQTIKRFLNVSSFAVYDPSNLKRGKILDETCPIIARPEERGEAYCYGKLKQDELVVAYNREHGIPYVIVRPGAVFGPGKNAVTGRVGIDTFGPYFHMGGTNQIPFTYVDNCADAIVFAAMKRGIDGEIFNIVDDTLPRSCDFLEKYKRNVKPFKSINIHHRISYVMSWMWEKYAGWSDGQLPPVFNSSRWAAEWKGHRYSNSKLKHRTGWQPQVPMKDAMQRYFDYSKRAGGIQ